VAALAVAGLLGASVFALAAPAPAGKAYLGIAAKANESGHDGVVVHGFSPESPAGKAGVKEGDRIVMAGDKAVKTFADLKECIAAHKAGDKLALKVMRDDKEQSVTVTLAEEPARLARAPEPTPGATAAPTPAPSGPFLGVFTQPLKDDMKEHLGIKVEKGALVTQVMPDSPAAKAGVAELDVITRLGDTAVNSPQDLRQAVEKAGAGKEVTLQVVRGGKTLDLKAKLGEQAASGSFGPENGFGFGPENGFPKLPQGFEKFQGHMPSFFAAPEKVSTLEKKVQELEKRVEQLERNQAKPAR
jgi:S1-C subfamily serine protease